MLACTESSSAAASLLDHDVDLVAVVHLERLWRVVILDPLSIEDKATLVVREALSLTVCFHQLLQLGRLFDLEEYL